MQVILLEKIRNLGLLGDTVTVKSGYGRNYLIPQKKAVFATPDNVKMFEERREELEKKAAQSLAQAEQRAAKLNDVSIIIEAQASDEGKLYGSIGTVEISRAITDAGVEVNKNEVLLPEGALRTTGEFDIQVSLHSDVTVELTLAIEAE